MKGYWNNDAANAQALRDGWLWTGDLGSMDADGFVTLKDRSKDLIISGGANIYPREIEEVLLTHAAVLETAVVSRPHADWGEEVIAFVVKREGADVTAAELDQLCLDNIARFKRPKGYRFVEALPKNNYGKILKTELREQRQAGASVMSTSAPEFLSLQALADRIPNGARIALPADYSGCAMAAVRALMRRPVRDLHIVSVPQGGFQVDMLVGAGCVARIEAAAVTLGEHGLAPRFTAAIKAGEIEMWDATCPAIHAGLQAAEKGVPFMPLRGIIGSDLLRVRPDWKVIDNPLGESGTRDPIVILPAIRPDVTLFHALKADSPGQRVDRRAARAGDHGARLAADVRDGRAHRGRRFPARSGARRRHHPRPLHHGHRRGAERGLAGRPRQCVPGRYAGARRLCRRCRHARGFCPLGGAARCRKRGLTPAPVFDQRFVALGAPLPIIKKRQSQRHPPGGKAR